MKNNITPFLLLNEIVHQPVCPKPVERKTSKQVGGNALGVRMNDI